MVSFQGNDKMLTEHHEDVNEQVDSELMDSGDVMLMNASLEDELYYRIYLESWKLGKF